jgi:hypothetical protein
MNRMLVDLQVSACAKGLDFSFDVRLEPLKGVEK